MWLSDSWVSYRKPEESAPVKLTVQGATTYGASSDGWKDFDNPAEKWLKLDCGANSISLRVTLAQLAQLADGFRAVLAHLPDDDLSGLYHAVAVELDNRRTTNSPDPCAGCGKPLPTPRHPMVTWCSACETAAAVPTE